MSNDLTPLQEAMASVREMFVALVDAGFSEGQASMIVGTYLATTVSSSRGEES